MAVRPKKDNTGAPIPGWWIIEYYPEGRKGAQIRRQIEGTEAEALHIEISLRRNSRRAAIPVNPRVRDLLGDFLEEYENNHLPNTVRDLRNCLVHLLPAFGELYLAEFSPATIEAYKGKRLRTEILPKNKAPETLDPDRKKRFPSKRTINKELTYLSSFLTWAADHGHCAPLPFKVKKFPANQCRPAQPRIPHKNEVEAIYRHLEAPYRLPFLLMYDGGLRREEALQLTAEDVHLQNGLIHIVGKGNKERVLPITTDRLHQALAEAIRNNGGRGYLSVNPKTEKPWYSIRKALTRAAKKAGVPGRVYHHLLRHSFGTHALIDGVNLRAIQGLMGHSTSQVTERYTHLANDYLRDEVTKIQRPAPYSRATDET